MDAIEPKFKNLVQLFRESVEKFSDRPLFGTKKGGTWSWLSYQDFGVLVDRARGGLSALGIQQGDRVAG